MARIVIPQSIPLFDWHMALAKAIKDSQPGDVIVVYNDHERQLAERAASRMNKTVVFEVEQD